MPCKLFEFLEQFMTGAFLITSTQFDKSTLVVKTKRKLRKKLSNVTALNVHFRQHFLRNSEKNLHKPGANDQSYPL